MYTLFYNKDCNDCGRQASTTSMLDWFNRIAVSTDIPPTGELEKGEIVLISNDGKAYSGGYATRRICLNVPVYFILGILLYIPPIFKAMSKGKAGCNGDSCDVIT